MQGLRLLHHRYLRWRRNRLFGDLLISAIVVTALAIFVMTLFVYLPIGAAAWHIGRVLSEMGVDKAVAPFVQQYVLWVLVSLMLPRILMQKGLSSRTLPYRTLPASVSAVLHTDLGLQLVSLHTLVPLAFFVPFWVRFILPEAATLDAAAWLWIAVMLVVAWTYAAVSLADRIVRGSAAFWLGVASVASMGAADIWLDIGIVTRVSSILFAYPLSGASIATLLAASCYTAAFRFRRSAAAGIDRGAEHVVPASVDALLDHIAQQSITGAATALELRLILRHARTRGILMMVCIVAVFVGFTLVLGIGLETNVILGVQYATAGFIFFYGPFLFSNQHGHLDGLFARPASAETLVRGKLYAVQITNLALFTLLSPGLLVLPLRDAAIIASWLPYTLWILAPFVLYLAADTQTPTDISRSVFAVQADVSTHLLPMIVPILGMLIGAMVQVTIRGWWPILSAVALGLAARLFESWAIRRTADRIHQRRHSLLHHLRTKDPS